MICLFLYRSTYCVYIYYEDVGIVLFLFLHIYSEFFYLE